MYFIRKFAPWDRGFKTTGMCDSSSEDTKEYQVYDGTSTQSHRLHSWGSCWFSIHYGHEHAVFAEMRNWLYLEYFYMKICKADMISKICGRRQQFCRLSAGVSSGQLSKHFFPFNVEFPLVCHMCVRNWYDKEPVTPYLEYSIIFQLCQESYRL